MGTGPYPAVAADMSQAASEATDSTRGLLSAADKTSFDATLGGTVANGRLKLATGPTANDTVTIGGHVFKFVTALGAADTFTQILNGTAANARAWFVEAINGTVDLTHVTPAAVPFAGLVLADVIDTDKVRVRSAATRGGAVAASATSVAVSEGLTAAADIWDVANLNESGKAAGAHACSVGAVTITAAMVTRAKTYIELPFTPVGFIPYFESSTGVPKTGVKVGTPDVLTTDALTIVGNSIFISLATGAAPDLVAGDVVRVFAWA